MSTALSWLPAWPPARQPTRPLARQQAPARPLAPKLARHLAVALLTIAPLAAGAAEPSGNPAPATSTSAKPATATPPAAKPAGSPAAGTARPMTPATAGSAATPAAAAGVAPVPSTDPAKDNISLLQATNGIKGVGTLFATIEIAVPNKAVQALHCELFADKAPLTVANFIGLARGLRPWKDPKSGQWVKKPLYDNNLVHRVVPELLIQAGDPSCSVDPTCRGAAGSGEPGYTIPDEIKPELRFDRPGRLAMSNRGPATSGSQFFITERDAGWLTGSHTIFGQCDAPELVSELSHVEAGSRDQPKVPLVIKRVTFIRKVK